MIKYTIPKENEWLLDRSTLGNGVLRLERELQQMEQQVPPDAAATVRSYLLKFHQEMRRVSYYLPRRGYEAFRCTLDMVHDEHVRERFGHTYAEQHPASNPNEFRDLEEELHGENLFSFIQHEILWCLRSDATHIMYNPEDTTKPYAHAFRHSGFRSLRPMLNSILIALGVPSEELLKDPSAPPPPSTESPA